MEISSSEDRDEIELLIDFRADLWVQVELRKARPIDPRVLPERRRMFKSTGEAATPHMLLLLGALRRRELRRKQLVDPMKVAEYDNAITILRAFLDMTIRRTVGPRYARCEFDIVHPNGEPVIVARGQRLK